VVQAKSEGIEFNPDGTITLIIDGTVRHLRRPKLKEFRYWSEQLRDLRKQAQEDTKLLSDMLERLADNPSEEEAEQLQKEADEAAERRVEYSTPWTAGVVEQFSGKPMPDDTGEWPAWLAMDLSIPAKILSHWRTVPLAPGGKGTS
jgi:hypothetical protein